MRIIYSPHWDTNNIIKVAVDDFLLNTVGSTINETTDYINFMHGDNLIEGSNITLFTSIVDIISDSSMFHLSTDSDMEETWANLVRTGTQQGIPIVELLLTWSMSWRLKAFGIDGVVKYVTWCEHLAEVLSSLSVATETTIVGEAYLGRVEEKESFLNILKDTPWLAFIFTLQLGYPHIYRAILKGESVNSGIKKGR